VELFSAAFFGSTEKMQVGYGFELIFRDRRGTGSRAGFCGIMRDLRDFAGCGFCGIIPQRIRPAKILKKKSRPRIPHQKCGIPQCGIRQGKN